MRKIVDTILPTTMVGSYPRPHWFTHQLNGRDVRVAFKNTDHAEAYADATHAVIHDQETAGLDIITDGQMYYDDYVGVIGSFCWYMYERIGGFEDVYDAVWTNVGRRIAHGVPYDLRVAFDGETYAVFVDDEPVLYRRISDIVPSAPRLRIERVGIVSNWEFGDDTGTRFLRFRARAGTGIDAAAAADKG